MSAMKKRLTDEEQNKLLREFSITRDPEIRARLILHNQTLASWHARKMSSYHLHADDLEQAAMIGIMRAIDLFDPDKGFKFSTYANVWMRHEIQEFYRRESVVPLSKEDSQRVNAEITAGNLSARGEYLNVVRNTYSIDVSAEFGGNLIQADVAVTDDHGEDQASYEVILTKLIFELTPERQRIVKSRLAGKPITQIAKDIGRSGEFTRQQYQASIRQLQGFADLYGIDNPFRE